MAELTVKSQRKLASLLQAGQDAEAHWQALRPKRQKFEDDLALAVRRARALPEDGARAQIVEDLTHELGGLTAEQERRRQKHEYAMINYNRCAEFARLLPYRAEVIDIEAPPARPTDGDLASVRAQIAQLRTAMAQLRAFAPQADEMEAMVRAYVERTGAAYTPRITNTTGGGLLVDYAYVNVVGNPLAPFGVLCWVAPDLVTAKLTAEVTAQIGTGGMSAADRADWDRKGTEEMDRLERIEESLVCEAIEAGVDVQRRYDAAPEAVLMVTVSNMAAAAA